MLRKYALAALVRLAKRKDFKPAVSHYEGQTLIHGGLRRAYQNAKALWRGGRFAV